MPTPDSLVLIALTTLGLFAVCLFSLIRLTRAGMLEGRNAGGSPSLEAILHSLAKMIRVIVVILAQSRILLAPHWPGGPFAPDLAMLFAGGVSLIAAVPAAGLLVMTVRPGARPCLAVLMVAALAAIIAAGAGQAVMSGIAAGRDLGSLLALSAAAPVLACGLVGGAGLYLHARLVRQLLAQPNSIRLALADTATSAISTALCRAWLPGLRDINLAFRNRTYAVARLRTGMCFLPQSFSPTSAGAKSRPLSDSLYSYRSGRCE